MPYIGPIHKDVGSDYGVSFPDLPGCLSAGRSFEEACLLAKEALTLHIKRMPSDSDAIPAPSSFKNVVADPENTGAIAWWLWRPRSPDPQPAAAFASRRRACSTNSVYPLA